MEHSLELLSYLFTGHMLFCHSSISANLTSHVEQ